MATGNYVVGIDVGGQTTKLGVVDARGTVLAQTVIRTDNHEDVRLYVAELAEAVKKIILDDFEYFMKLFKELSDEADDSKDKVSADYANGILAVLEKEIWMLKVQLK